MYKKLSYYDKRKFSEPYLNLIETQELLVMKGLCITNTYYTLHNLLLCYMYQSFIANLKILAKYNANTYHMLNLSLCFFFFCLMECLFLSLSI